MRYRTLLASVVLLETLLMAQETLGTSRPIAVFSSTCDAAVLADYPCRIAPLLEEAYFINDQHRDVPTFRSVAHSALLRASSAYTEAYSAGHSRGLFPLNSVYVNYVCVTPDGRIKTNQGNEEEKSKGM
jgi:hypothetical protein